MIDQILDAYFHESIDFLDAVWQLMLAGLSERSARRRLRS